MWISKRTDYATRAVLALALEQSGDAVKLEQLAERTEVPASVLEQVMPHCGAPASCGPNAARMAATG